MPNKLYPTDVLKQAQEVLSVWNEIGVSLVFGALTPNALSEDITAAADLENDMAILEAQLTASRNQRDALYSAIWDKVKRVRAGVKATYGDDSSQYEMVGGTRRSERKAPTRKTVTA